MVKRLILNEQGQGTILRVISYSCPANTRTTNAGLTFEHGSLYEADSTLTHHWARTQRLLGIAVRTVLGSALIYPIEKIVN